MPDISLNSSNSFNSRTPKLLYSTFFIFLISNLKQTMMEHQKICRLRDVYRAIAALEAGIEKQYGLNINEAMLLCTLNERGQMTVGDIREEMGLTYSNTSKVIASVEKQSLVRRTAQDRDHRCISVAITDEGRKRLEEVGMCEIAYPDILKDILEH